MKLLIFKHVTALATMLAISRFALAANAPDALPLDLMTAWQQAQAHDASFQAAKSAGVAAAEKRTQGDALLAPQVALNADASQAGQSYRPGNLQAKSPTDQSGQQYGAALSLSKPLFDAGASVNRDQLYKQADQAEVLLRIAEQDLILRTAKAYFDALVSAESLKLLQTQKQAVSEQLALARQSFDLGLVSASDVNDAQSKYDTIVAGEIAGRADLESARQVFAQVTGASAGSLAVATNAGEPFQPDAHLLPFWLDRTQDQSLIVRAQQLSLGIAGDEIQRYTLRHSPVLSLVSSFGRSWGAGSISASGGRDATTSASIGVVLNIPLYDGGARSSRLRQAYALQDQQKYTLDETRRDAERLTRLYFTGVSTDAQRVQALIKARDSSAAAVQSTRLGQELGVRNVIDVLTAQQNFFQTSLALVTARYDYLLNRLQLAATAGALDEPALREVNAFLQKP
jgi:outer membrane protein